MRTIRADIFCMIPGRPGPRRCTKLHFSAISRCCQRISVSGETIVSRSNTAFRPRAMTNAYHLRAAGVKWHVRSPPNALFARPVALCWSLGAMRAELLPEAEHELESALAVGVAHERPQAA